MLTAADQAIWQHFLAALSAQTERLKAEDMLPLALVFTRVRGRHDDGALVGLGPGDMSVLTLPTMKHYDLAAMLDAAAARVRQGRTG
jgi:hypothetical protein